MIRWATCVLATLTACSATTALAEVPLPKPKPNLTAQADPQAAITRFVSGANTLGNTVTAYAPSNDHEQLRPPVAGLEIPLYVVGKLAEDGGPIGDGLVWRVFRDYPDESGQLPLVYKNRGGDLEARLPEGRYIVHVAYGRAALSRVIDLRGPSTNETFVLNAGGLLLDAVLDDDDATRTATDAKFELYTSDQSGRHMVGTVRRGAIARLPAGSYHVVSKYGNVNAVRSADVTVEPGKLTRVSLRHQAGKVRLKLVRSAGGEAIADTAWTIYGDDGEPVFERVGAHANVTLAAGRYAVVAKHRDGQFSRRFTVESGDEEDVVVVAQRFASPF